MNALSFRFKYLCKRGNTVMKKLHIYMLKSYLGPFVFTFFIALFILLLQFLWKYLDDLVGKGLEWYIIAKLMFYASSTFVPLALPLAILLSSLMTFGNLGEHYELVAMKSAGISLRKAMKPLIFLAVLLSLTAFYFSNYVLPVANLKFGSLLYDVRQQKLAFNLNEGIFNDGLDNFVIYVGEKDKDNKTIYDVKIYDHSQRKGNVKVVSAKKGIMELSPDQTKVIFTLFDGSRYTEITDKGYKENRPFEVLHFEKFVRSFDLTQFKLNRTNEELFKSHYSMLNMKQLNYSIDSLSNTRIRRVEFYQKKTMKQYPHLLKMDAPEKEILAKVDSTGIDSTSTNSELTKTDIIDSIIKTKPDYKKLILNALAYHITEYNGLSKPDTITVAELKYPLIDNYDHDDQIMIIETSLNAASNARNNAKFYKDELESRRMVIAKHQVIWHQKLKLSLACLIFFFIGAPLGAIIRKGGLGLPVVVSVVFFVLYHVVSMTGEKAAKTGEWDVIFGTWLSTILILPLGLFLTYKATTDAPLLDAESWKKYFENFRIVKMIKKKK